MFRLLVLGICLITFLQFSGCKKTVDEITECAVADFGADFSISVPANHSVAPVPVTFQYTSNASSNIRSYTWTFGDGTPTGTGNQITHIYQNLGEYTVTLSVMGIVNGDVCIKRLSKRLEL